VLGILGVVLGVVCINPLSAIPAVICGYMTSLRINGSNGARFGSGLASGDLINPAFRKASALQHLAANQKFVDNPVQDVSASICLGFFAPIKSIQTWFW
jgi:hypothetical protein